MNVLLGLILIILFVFILRLIAAVLFALFCIGLNKTFLWIITMFFLNFCFIYFGSHILNPNLIGLSAFITFLIFIATSQSGTNNKEREEIKKLADEMDSDFGLKKGSEKRRYGFISFLLGGIAAQVLYYI